MSDERVAHLEERLAFALEDNARIAEAVLVLLDFIMREDPGLGTRAAKVWNEALHGA